MPCVKVEPTPEGLLFYHLKLAMDTHGKLLKVVKPLPLCWGTFQK